MAPLRLLLQERRCLARSRGPASSEGQFPTCAIRNERFVGQPYEDMYDILS